MGGRLFNFLAYRNKQKFVIRNKSQRMDKHILFYSNLCQFSQDAIQLIYKKNVRDQFLNICIENPKYQQSLPPFVDRVPLILTADKQIVVDENGRNNIEFFISLLGGAGSQQQQPSQQQQQPAADEKDMTPFSALEMGSKFSDGFSYISEGEAGDPFGWSHNYVRIGGDDSLINPVNEGKAIDKIKIKDSMYESYIADRSRFDDTHYKQPRM